MDGAMAAGLIAASVSLGVNGVGWAITLWKGSKQESRLQGAFEQKVKDICEDVDKVDNKVEKVDLKIEKVKSDVVSHILNHPGRSIRK